MEPRIAAVQGPLKGQTLSIIEEEVSIGREASNSLCINDPRISRRHSLIERKGDRFKISDLDSTNGTFINGVPIKERFLDHGDRISIGGSLLLFLLTEEQPFVSSAVQLDEGDQTFQFTAQLRQEESLYLQQGDPLQWHLPGHLPAERMARDLHALLKISTTINSVRGLEPLLKQLLELVFEVVPGERGAILIGEEGENYSLALGWDRLSGTERAIRVSRTIVDRVFREGSAILCNQIRAEEALRDAQSLADSGAQSVLCVPLQLFNRIIGVIYIETTNSLIPFDEDHLQFLTATAAAAAVALENARHVEWLEGENRRLQADINIEHSMVGESSAMGKVYEFIAKVAPTDSTVLIAGENGTGKELVARAIHQNSPRSEKPFVAINCAALQESLLESELFGHKKGAFTGAIKEKKGKLEIANGGTVLLDEVGDLAPALQAKLLRVLQEHELERVGGTRPIKVNIRLIAATNRNLEEAITEGTFRQDLYYRLNVVSLTMPLLRERREDIPLLAHHFAAKYSKKCNRPVVGISPEARELLMSYSWPGNVRELENAIERAVVLGTSDVILPEELPESLLETEAAVTIPNTYHEALRERKKELILNALKRAEGNYTEAAKLLDLHPNYLHRLIGNLDLKKTLKVELSIRLA
ncbi:MAG: sigma 54-interacting transcriptional regulator [Acidobacteriota bacterium]